MPSARKDKGGDHKEAIASKQNHVRVRKFIQKGYIAQIDP
jgi:hypothetical protein